MSAWVRPVEYDVGEGEGLLNLPVGSAGKLTRPQSADHGIIMNKEGTYEMGLEQGTGAKQFLSILLLLPSICTAIVENEMRRSPM